MKSTTIALVGRALAVIGYVPRTAPTTGRTSRGRRCARISFMFWSVKMGPYGSSEPAGVVELADGLVTA